MWARTLQLLERDDGRNDEIQMGELDPKTTPPNMHGMVDGIEIEKLVHWADRRNTSQDVKY